MIASLRHRGPDGDGVFTDVLADTRSIGMGHNRLSIIDLTDRASQPMRSLDGRYVLVYNGEVYNYREIGEELRSEASLTSDGDTAVVLAALIKWGPAALQRFNGMWALALLDRREQTLLISRDRFGKKPLYFYQDAGCFYLGSEVKAILAGTGLRFHINPSVAVPYLTRGLLDFSDETFFDGIRQFPAASFQILKLTHDARIGEGVQRYWWHPVERGLTPERGGPPPSRIREVFVDAVNLRLRSDVPVGVLLSGGVDSSSIVGAISTAGLLGNVTVLSVISDDPESNEEPFIDAMTRYTGCVTHKINVSTDPHALMDTVSDATWFNDGPLGAISSLAHITLMKRAAENHIKVLLTGQGADEQLGGYNKFLYFYLLDLLKGGHYGAAARTLLQFARGSNTLAEFRLSEALRYMAPDRLSSGTYIAPAFQRYDTVDIGFAGSYIRREWIDLTKTSVPALLHGEDRMSMSKSIEMRVPFLDYRVVELLAQVHPSEKFAGGWTKSIFRKAIEGLVPEDIRFRRDKKGFTVPGNDWMRGQLSARLMEVFGSEMMMEQLRFVRGRELRAGYASFRRGRGYLNGRQFFRAYAFEAFLRRFEGSVAAA
jgi:asparagine synthase (glutamine-hydrolysing)